MKTSRKTMQKYQSALTIIKAEVENGNIPNGSNTISNIIKEQKLSSRLHTVLRGLDVLDGHRNKIKWNSRIPVTPQLTKRVLEAMNEKSPKAIQPKKNVVKQTSKPRQKQKLTYTITSPIQQPKVGLIRRFLRWIY